MSRPILPDPDAMPLREALRGLRHVLRRGGMVLRDSATFETLPGPSAALAGAVLREAEALAEGVDHMASRIARGVLGSAGPAPTLTEIDAGDRPDAVFAASVYAALRQALDRLGAASALVSEAAARRAYGQSRAPGGIWAAAATLTLALLEARVVRDVPVAERNLAPAASPEPIAVFAVMLWLLAERSDADSDAALAAAVDIASGLSGEVAAAAAVRDGAAFARLYREFVPHV